MGAVFVFYKSLEFLQIALKDGIYSFKALIYLYSENGRLALGVGILILGLQFAETQG